MILSVFILYANVDEFYNLKSPDFLPQYRES